MGKVTQNEKNNHNKPKVLTFDFYKNIGEKIFKDMITKRELNIYNYSINHEITCECHSCFVIKEHLLIDFCKEQGIKNKCKKLLACKLDDFMMPITTHLNCKCNFCKRIQYHTAQIFLIKLYHYTSIIRETNEENNRLISSLKKSKSSSSRYTIQCKRGMLFHQYNCAYYKKKAYMHKFINLIKLGYTDKSINIPSTDSLMYNELMDKMGWDEELDELTPEDFKEIDKYSENIN